MRRARWDGDAPEGEPPGTRQLADDPEEQHQEQTADDPGEREGFRLVAKPAGPALHGEPVLEREVLGVEIDGRLRSGRR